MSFPHPPAVIPAKAGIQGRGQTLAGTPSLHNLALHGEDVKPGNIVNVMSINPNAMQTADV